MEAVLPIANLGTFGRACRGEHYSGDLALIHDAPGGYFLAIIDSAGHGRSAYEVSCAIEDHLRDRDTSDVTAIFEYLHEMLKGGPGAVMIAGHLNTTDLTFTYVHIGDSHGKIFGDKRRTLVGQAGMLGHVIPTPEIQQELLSVGDTLVLCTDGITERYDLTEIKGQRSMPVDGLAQQLVDQFGKHHDDATCLVVRCC